MSKSIESRRQRRRGMIGEVLPDECITPQGVYQIELCDDRGRVIDKVKTNYISPSWANFAKMWQAMWPAYIHYGVHNSNIYDTSTLWPFPNDRVIHPFAQRPLPINDIILTTSQEAENTAVHWLKGNVVAWASYWKSANIPASGRRGQINEAECTISIDGQVHRRVWDWSTQQGNGEYQTLGIGIINRNGGHDCISVQMGPHTIVGPSLTAIQALFTDIGAGATNMAEVRAMHISGGKCFLYVTSNTASAPAQYRNRILYCTIPGTLATSDFDGSGLVLDLSGATWIALRTNDSNTNYESFPSMTTSSGTNTNHHWRYERGLWCEGTTMYWVERQPTGTTRGPRIGKSSFATPNATTTTWFKDMGTDYGRNANNSDNSATSICKVGSYLYVGVANTGVSGGAGGEVWRNQLYRINEATGALDGLVPLPTNCAFMGGLTTDGTDLFVLTVRGIIKMTVTGTFIENYGMPHGVVDGDVEYALSPWNPATGGPSQLLHPGAGQGWTLMPGGGARMWHRDTTYTTHYERYMQRAPYARNGNGDVFTVDWNMRIINLWNNRLWMPANNLSDSGLGPNNITAALMGVTGGNMFSRALLDTPVTKTSSQTMKVSYELTLPDMDTWWHSHAAV